MIILFNHNYCFYEYLCSLKPVLSLTLSMSKKINRIQKVIEIISQRGKLKLPPPIEKLQLKLVIISLNLLLRTNLLMTITIVIKNLPWHWKLHNCFGLNSGVNWDFDWMIPHHCYESVSLTSCFFLFSNRLSHKINASYWRVISRGLTAAMGNKSGLTSGAFHTCTASHDSC